MAEDQININWNYHGKADFLMGTGATKAEKSLVWVAGFVGFGLYVYLYFIHALDWTWWQYLLAGMIALDVIGGIVANSLNSCKRFYNTPPKLDEPSYTPFFKNHLAFTLLHIYPLIVAILYGARSYFYGVFWYLLLIALAIAILKIPLYLRRPAAFFAIALSLLINLYIVLPVHGFEWLVPALFMKILYGHLVREEPYRPENE